MPEMPVYEFSQGAGEVWQIPDTPPWNELYLMFEDHQATTEDLVTLLYEGKGGITPQYMKEIVLAWGEGEAEANWKYYGSSLWSPELYVPAAFFKIISGSYENRFDSRVRESLRRVVRTYMSNTASTSFDAMRRSAASEFNAVYLDITESAGKVRSDMGAFAKSWWMVFAKRYLVFVGGLRLLSEAKGKLAGGVGNVMQRISDSMKAAGVLQKAAGGSPGVAGWVRSGLIEGARVSRAVADFARGTLEWPWKMTKGVGYGVARTLYEGALAPIHLGRELLGNVGMAPGKVRKGGLPEGTTMRSVFVEPWQMALNTARTAWTWYKGAIDVHKLNLALSQQGITPWDILAQGPIKEYGRDVAMRVVKPATQVVRELWDEISTTGIVAPGTAAMSAGLASLATVATSAAGVVLMALAAAGLGALVMRLILNAVDGATEVDVGAANWQGDPADADPLVDVAQEMAGKLIPHVQEVVAIRQAVDAGPKIPEDPALWPGNMQARIQEARTAISSLSGAGVNGGSIIDVTRDNLLQQLSEIESKVPVRVQAAVEVDPDILRYAEMYATWDLLLEVIRPRLEAYFGQMEAETMSDDEFASTISQILDEAIAANDPTIEDAAADAIGAFVRDVAVPIEEDADSPTGYTIAEEESYPVVDEAILLITVLSREFSKTSPDLPIVDDALTAFEYIIPELPMALTDEAREILVGFAGVRAMATLMLDQSESQTVFGDTSPATVGYPYIPPPTPEEIQSAGG